LHGASDSLKHVLFDFSHFTTGNPNHVGCVGTGLEGAVENELAFALHRHRSVSENFEFCNLGLKSETVGIGHKPLNSRIYHGNAEFAKFYFIDCIALSDIITFLTGWTYKTNQGQN
jgi:hypothetical protein